MFLSKELDESGLFSKKDDRFYDRFRGRVIFPIRNIKGDFIAMGGRIIDEGEPKYLNSPETSFFNKSNELFGLYEVKEREKNIASLIVVEGYMDVIGLYEHGIKNAVATLGTAVTPNHVSKIMRYTNKIFLPLMGIWLEEKRPGKLWKILSQLLEKILISILYFLSKAMIQIHTLMNMD